jgi:hypothetical protein
MGIEDIRFDWPEFLPGQHKKEGTAGIAFEFIAFAALVYGARWDRRRLRPIYLSLLNLLLLGRTRA